MKKQLYILSLFCLISLSGKAQDDSLAVVRAWMLDQDFRNYSEVNVDTNLTDFHVYYPNYKLSVSNTFLGNPGTASVSNIFSERLTTNGPFFLNQYLSYFYTAENSRYYNSRKPYSFLGYTNGGQEVNREESFEGFITQNINPQLNFALQYNYFGSKGQYEFQHLKKHAIRGTVNFAGERYSLFGTLNFNNHKANENGGLDDEIFENHTYVFFSDISSVIGGSGTDSYARNDIRHFDIMLNQRLELLSLFSGSKKDTSQAFETGQTDGFTNTTGAANAIQLATGGPVGPPPNIADTSMTADSVKTISPSEKAHLAEPILNYTIRAQRAAKKYSHLSPANSGLYDVNYFNSGKTLDSLADFRLTNTLSLEFKTTFKNKVQVGLYGGLRNEINSNYFFSEWDSTYTPADTLVSPIVEENGDTTKGVDFKNSFSSTSFIAGLYGVFWDKVKTDFSTQVYFLGYKAGETDLKGHISTEVQILKREFLFDVSAGLMNKVPDYLFQNYYSNHYVWNETDQNLTSEIWTSLSGKISSPSNKFELTGNYYLISGLIYFNQDARPVNADNAVNLLSLGVAKTFRLWKLHSKNKLIYQLTENPEILAIPNLVFFNSTYYNHNFNFESTGGELEIMLGVEFYYTTRFYGYEYSPALAQFYTQDSELIGNYPMLDVFVNAKLKRARFFFKLQNLSSRYGQQNYYAALHYPHHQVLNNNNLIFKFGVSWAFFD